MPRIVGWLRTGDWVPGSHNLAMLLVQLLVLAQTSLRGFDYLQPQDDSGLANLGAVEALFPLPAWGAALLAVTALALIGLAGRWAAPIMIGHALGGSIYIGIGIGILVTNGDPVGGVGFAGLVVAVAGTWLIVKDYAPTPVRVLIGVTAVLLGQYLMSTDLGAGYRTGTTLIGGGLIHWVIGLGTLVLVIRQRVTSQRIDEESATREPR